MNNTELILLAMTVINFALVLFSIKLNILLAKVVKALVDECQNVK